MKCDRCGIRIVRGDYITSKYTKKRYCKNVRTCDARAKGASIDK